MVLVACVLTGAACSDDDTGTQTAGTITTTSPAASDGGPAAGSPDDDGFVYPADAWERADPEELGFDPVALEAIAADAEALGIGQPARDRVIDRGEVVLHIDASPAGINAHRVLGPAAGRAAVVDDDLDGDGGGRHQRRVAPALPASHSGGTRPASGEPLRAPGDT